MSKMNLLLHINMYQDENPTNNPLMNNVRWERSAQGISISEPTSKSLVLAAGQSLSLFDGIQTISADNTTKWDITLKSGTSNTYKISYASGTLPVFRTLRSVTYDATTEVTITKNAKLLIFESTAGTIFDLINDGVIVGDEVRIGDGFNVTNQGKFSILALTATSFTIENESGEAEGPIVLGADFADDIRIYSANGVQVGSKIDIIDGFSSVSFGAYEITDVADDFIEFFSNDSLPSELDVSNNPDAFLIYQDAKQFIYIESDQKLDIKINGSTVTNQLNILSAGTARKPGMFMNSGSLKSVEIVNKSQQSANIFYTSAE